MVAHRFWRLAGFSVAGNGPLELSEAQLYTGGAPADADATLTCTLAPASGTLADLRDGLATGVVSWPHAAHASPGFALVWDFGVGGVADINSIIFGSGSAAATFPTSFTCQHSNDGIVWTTGATGNVTGVIYPGSNALTSGSSGDPYADNVVALLRFDGSMTDDTGRVWTQSGGDLSYVASPPFGMMLSRPDGYACAHSESVDFGLADFTIEITVDLPAATGGGPFYAWMLTQDYATPGLRDWQFLIDVSTNTVYVGIPGIAMAAGVSAGRHRLAWCRSGTMSRLFVDGVPIASGTLSGALGSSARLAIGPYLGGGSNVATTAPFLIDELRITKGVARYANTYTPAAGPLPYVQNLMPTEPSANKWKSSALPQVLAADALAAGSVKSHLREHTFMDAYHGGRGLIRSTVKQKDTPVNTPLRRRVDLIDERSRLTVRETWSDAATGNYEFRGIREDLVYSVAAWDHLHTYRAEMADHLTLANDGVELLP